MKLLIVRHGETEENIAQITQGHLPGKLSRKGLKQTKKLALRLKEEKIDFIYSSDLARAADTAKKIAKFHPKTKIKFVKELREIYWGKFQGRKKKETFEERYKELEKENSTLIETKVQLFERADNFLHKTLDKHKKEATVLFVAHGKINRAIITIILGKGPKDFDRIEHSHNTGVWIFEIDEDKNHKIHTFNCIKHLN